MSVVDGYIHNTICWHYRKSNFSIIDPATNYHKQYEQQLHYFYTFTDTHFTQHCHIQYIYHQHHVTYISFKTTTTKRSKPTKLIIYL